MNNIIFSSLFKKIALVILFTSSSYSLSQQILNDTSDLKQQVNKMMKILIQKDKSIVDLKNENGETAINLLVRRNNVEGVEILASAGADINLPNDGGDTPLISVACYNHTPQTVEIAQILLDHGADINAQEEVFNFTATHCALITNDLELALFLIQKEDLDITIEDIDGDDLLGILEYKQEIPENINTEEMELEQIRTLLIDILKEMIEDNSASNNFFIQGV